MSAESGLPLGVADALRQFAASYRPEPDGLRTWHFGTELRRAIEGCDEGVPAALYALPFLFQWRPASTVSERYQRVHEHFRFSARDAADELLEAARILGASILPAEIRARFNDFLFVHSQGRERFELLGPVVDGLVEAAMIRFDDEPRRASEYLCQAGLNAASMNDQRCSLRVRDALGLMVAETMDSADPLPAGVLLARVSRSLEEARPATGVAEALAGDIETLLETAIETGGPSADAWFDDALFELELLATPTNRLSARIRRVRRTEVVADRHDSALAASMLLMGAVDLLLDGESRYGATESSRGLVRDLEKKAREKTREGQAELKPVGVEMNIDRSRVEAWIANLMGEDDPVQRIHKAIIHCDVPDLEDMRTSTAEMLEPFVFWRLFPSHAIEGDRPAGRSNTEEERLAGEVNRQILERARLRAAVFLCPALRRMLTSGCPSSTQLVRAFHELGLVDAGLGGDHL